MLRPDEISLEHYLKFRICHKMAKLGLNPNTFFGMLDKEDVGEIDCNKFINGIYSELDLWLPKEDV